MSVKKNFLYNAFYQILIMILPLLTAPYLARTVGAEGLGTYAYTFSIANYFVLIAMLGVNNYGNRSIAMVRSDKSRLSKTFWEIYTLQLVMSVIIAVVYIIYVMLFVKNGRLIFLLQFIYLLSAALDINWFFFGLEQFKITVTRNTVVKVLTVISVFLFVKNDADLWKYTLIMASGILFSQCALWPFVHRYVSFVRVSLKRVLVHLKPNLVLFVPVIAISIYKILDKIMLGKISTIAQVGFFDNADKIINVPLSLVTALGTVMLPRMSNLISQGMEEQGYRYIRNSIYFIMFLSSAMAFGLAGIAPEFAPVFFGRSFAICGLLIAIMAPTIIFISWANVIRMQYLIPNKKDKIYVISVLLGAIINIIVNILLIPRMGAVGTAIGTLCAEASVMIYQTVMVRKELPIGKYVQYSASFPIFGIAMYYVVRTIGNHMGIHIMTIVMQVIAGGTIYLVLCAAYIWSIMAKRKRSMPKRK
ncbi:MAG: flippase [Oscillospiraceae bacterium]|jgi:O-antigen/teichoic acid export membrane protein|nr:flippase [Oscillospiraceae bacterium]